MPQYTIQATIPTADNNVANYATNTWHVQADDLTAVGNAFTALTTFYNSMRPQMSALCRQNGWSLKAYDLADPTPRAPVLELVFSLASAPAGGGLPPEVALCMSFQGVRQSGIPQSRRRGRIYFPFIISTNNGSDGRPIGTLVTALVAAGDALLAASLASATWEWCVLSTVAGVSMVPITNGWVDNEWDTQRRRGRLATSRTTFD